MAQDHYRILGIAHNATPADIKSAYRKLVLAHHPDKSPSKQSADIFLKATEAYEVLGDSDRRKQYDGNLDHQRRQANQPRPQTQTQARPQPKPQPTKSTQTVSTVAAEVTKLTLIFTRGQYTESETLARNIIRKDNKQPIPYAVLGDIARAKGRLDEAAKMYAYAAQMDPRNPIYQQRHEELIRNYRDAKSPNSAAKATQKSAMTIIVGTLLVVSAGLYVMLAKEPVITPGLGLINTWTLGLVIMLFLSGVSTGAVLCAGDYIDRFNAATIVATGRVSSPILMLAMVAIVNFWAAAVLYALVTISQRGFTVSHLRFMIGIGVTTLIMAGAAALSIANFNPVQVLLWGGNLAYLGGICGWMVADSFKRI